ncbi:MAG: helix-turn-helix transcriptional regulator [Firmicutes bacterium]|nr:helix-turn-helix transcriptional regulator [Bacillota bacterium]
MIYSRLGQLNERQLAIIVHSLFSGWMLSFIFEGQILYTLSEIHDINIDIMIFGGLAAFFLGLILSGFFVKSQKRARRLFLYCYPVFILISLPFFSEPSLLWTLGIIIGSFLAGNCVASWGYYLKSSTPKSEKIKTIADMIILSNILMIIINIATIHISYFLGLALSIVMLLFAFMFALKLPIDYHIDDSCESAESHVSIKSLLVFLCFFIIVITINSGLMYEVVNPAFEHLKWLTSWYWAVPYIIAILIMRNLPKEINRSHLLYVAIAMMGISFISFMCLGRNAISYIIIDTLMLGACGVYDLFWWSILGESLDFRDNSARILGIGLSANILGILLGAIIGNIIIFNNASSTNPTLLALTVVCVGLALLPFLHKHLSFLLKDHIYLKMYSEMIIEEQDNKINHIKKLEILSEREKQVTSRLLQGKTYKTIAEELFISENTVKYFVKNIYSKFNIRSRSELIETIFDDKN